MVKISIQRGSDIDGTWVIVQRGTTAIKFKATMKIAKQLLRISTDVLLGGQK